jgi:hypothetical protein
MAYWAVLDIDDVVLDTFLLNADTIENIDDKAREYDSLYPNRVSKIVNATGKSPRAVASGWLYKGEEDKFYPPIPDNPLTNEPYLQNQIIWSDLNQDWSVIED